MEAFDVAYADQRSSILMTARLLHRYDTKNGKFVFDESKYLPYQGETKFRCRLRVTTDIQGLQVLSQNLQAIKYDTHDATCFIRMSDGLMEVRCPIESQGFRPASSTKNHNPVSFYTEPNVALIQHTSSDVLAMNSGDSNSRSTLRVSLTYWISIYGPSWMFVKDRIEKFEFERVVSGGRPESNRRKF